MTSRRQAGLVAILVSHALVLAMAASFHVKARVAVVSAFREFDTAMPGATALAVSPWFLPGASALGLALTAVALVAPLRRSRRMGLCALGLVISSFALVFAVLAAFVPIFRPEG